PKPSCAGYSPPPALISVETTLYFSIIFPVASYTCLLIFNHLVAISIDKSSCPYLARPWMAIHCSGGHPFGASHCWSVVSSVVINPPGERNFSLNIFATPSACSSEAISKYKGNAAARVKDFFCLFSL